MTLVTNIRVNVDPGATPASDVITASYLVDARSPSVTKQTIRTLGAAALVRSGAAGELPAFAAGERVVPVAYVSTDSTAWESFEPSIFRPESHGAIPDAETVSNGTTVATDATLTSASNPWVAADVGKVIRVRGAGAVGADHYTTIASFTSAGSIEMTDAAVTSVAGTAVVDWGTDNSTAIQAALTACSAAGGGVVQLSTGVYGVTANLGLTSATGVTVRGMGMGASTIKDLRDDPPPAPAAGGAPTGAYYGLLSFVTCTNCGVGSLSLIGAMDPTAIGVDITTSLGRKATFFSGSSGCFVDRVRAVGFHDEAIFADNDSPDWKVSFCIVDNCNSNAFNLNSGATTQSDGFAFIGCTSKNNCGSAFLVSANGGSILGCTMSHGTPSYDADLVGLDCSGTVEFIGNTLQNTEWTTAVKALAIWGGAGATTAVAIVAGNAFKGLIGEWRTPNGGLIDVSARGAAAPPAGRVLLSGNVFEDNEGLVEGENRLIVFESCAATFRGYVSGNVAVGDDGAFMRTFCTTTTNAAGARVRIGDNDLDGWITEYNNTDGAMVFNGTSYSTGRALTNAGSPYASLATDFILEVDTAGGAVTYKLPAPATFAGRDFYIGDDGQTASTAAITIDADTDGSTTINGVASIDITTDGGGAWVHCDGSVYKTRGNVL